MFTDLAVIVLTNIQTNRRRWKHPTLFATLRRWVRQQTKVERDRPWVNLYRELMSRQSACTSTIGKMASRLSSLLWLLTAACWVGNVVLGPSVNSSRPVLHTFTQYPSTQLQLAQCHTSLVKQSSFLLYSSCSLSVRSFLVLMLCTFYFDLVTAVCQLLINGYVMLCYVMLCYVIITL